MEDVKELKVEELPIKLGQLLKLANLVQDGFEAKIRIQYGEVEVNGETETRRGRKIIAGDTITYEGHTFRVSA